MSNTTTQTLTVTVSADVLSQQEQWMRGRTALLDQAAVVTRVEDDEQLSFAGHVQTAIAKQIKALEAERKRVTRPLDEVKREIMQQEKTLRSPLEQQLHRIKRLNDDYATRQAAAAAEERRRQEEALNQQRLAAAAEQERVTEMFGAGAVLRDAPVAAPEPVPDKPRTDGARIVKRWMWMVMRPELVPSEYLSVDETKIRAHVHYCERMGREPEIPGVSFSAKMSVESK